MQGLRTVRLCRALCSGPAVLCVTVALCGCTGVLRVACAVYTSGVCGVHAVLVSSWCAPIYLLCRAVLCVVCSIAVGECFLYIGAALHVVWLELVWIVGAARCALCVHGERCYVGAVRAWLCSWWRALQCAFFFCIVY